MKSIGLSKEPVAIGFLDAAPAGMETWGGGPVAAGCAFWRTAMNGRSFYTEPSDHYQCAVGAYTHAIAIPAGQGAVLQDTIGFMVGNGYLQLAEIPSIPKLAATPKFVAYAPASKATFPADVIVLAARPAAAMLIYEAALRAGAGDPLMGAIGRPACAVLPLTMQSGKAALSFGCKGNRTFTGLPDEELYLAIPAAKWDAVVAVAEEITNANAAMEAHYKAHEAAVQALG